MLLDEIAAALANEPQAEPARKLTYEDADEIPCPHCEGTGTETSLSGGGPDAYDVEHDCSHCAGNQTLGAAYRTLIQDLKAAQKAHTDACARLYAAPSAEQPGAVGLSEREAFEAHYAARWGRGVLGVAQPSGRYEWDATHEAWTVWQARAALAAAQPVAAGRSQHDADSAELRSLCQARDDARRERDAMRAELAGMEASSGHLSALVDDLRGLLAESMRVMKALHESATPDDGPDMDAIIPAGAFRQFVDDNAQLMHLIHVSPHELPVAAGWKLVPMEPTEAMFTAFSGQIEEGVVYVGGFLLAYRTMLDAAPVFAATQGAKT